MRTTNYSELRGNLKGYLDGVVMDNEPLIVHRPGNTSVVVISLDEYNAMQETQYIMSSPVMMDKIKQAEKNISEGKYEKIDIDNLWK